MIDWLVAVIGQGRWPLRRWMVVMQAGVQTAAAMLTYLGDGR